MNKTLYFNEVNFNSNKLEINRYSKNCNEYEDWLDFIYDINIDKNKLIYIDTSYRIIFAMYVSDYIEIFFDFDYLFCYINDFISYNFIKGYENEDTFSIGRERYDSIVKKFVYKINSLYKNENNNLLYNYYSYIVNVLFKDFINKIYERYAVKHSSVFYYRIKNNADSKNKIYNFLSKIKKEMGYVVVNNN